jgi:hypothetical protein
MSIHIGTKISDIQNEIIDNAKRTKDLSEKIQSMFEVITDDDITSGREDVHPYWYQLFQSRKTDIKK